MVESRVLGIKGSGAWSGERMVVERNIGRCDGMRADFYEIMIEKHWKRILGYLSIVLRRTEEPVSCSMRRGTTIFFTRSL